MDFRESWPLPIRRRVGSALLTDSSGCSGATTWRVETEPYCYLKIAPAGALRQDAEGLRWFSGGPFLTPQVLEYCSAEQDYLITAPVPGTPAFESPWRDDPRRMAALLGEALRAFHEAYDPSGCPLHNSVADMLARVERNVAEQRWEDSMLAWMGGCSAEDAHRRIQQGAPSLKDDVVLHGDYCLPNVLLERWRVTGLLDLGMSGVGDRHYDLHWGCWSLDYNLHTRQWTDTFLDAYGRDAIDPVRLELAGLISAMDE